MNRNSLIAIAAVVVVAIGGYFFWSQNQSAVAQSTQVETPDAPTSDTDTSGVVEMTLGDADAPVTIIEYASFTCPHCKTFHEGAFKQLKADYIDTGKVHFIYREMYFDRPGLWAGMVARCGGSDRYFGIADLIYQTQGEWARENSPAAIAEGLRRIGRTAGLNDDELNACLQDAEKAEALVAAYEANANADGIRSTPSFVINGTTYSNMAYSEFQRIIDEAAGDS